MKVREVMVSPVITCTDRAALADAVQLMWQHDIGFVPVVSADTGALAGVITDRDACIAAWFQGKPLREIGVRSAMSARLATCRPDSEVDEAEVIMSEFQVHRLPVITEKGELVGVVSINDLAQRAAKDADEELEGEVTLTLGAITHPRQATAAEPG